MIRKNPDSASEGRWGLTAARRRYWQPRQILAMAVKAQVTAAPVSCPLPAAWEWGAGRSSGAGPCIASRPDPVAGINRDTVRAPAADPGRRQARATRHLAGIPGRRLMPAAQPAKSPGTPPGDDDLDPAAAHPGRRQTACAARRATASARRPGRRARGHAARRPVSGKDCRRPGSTTGTDPGRGRTAPSPVPRTAHGKPADRAGKTGRSLASPPAQRSPFSCR
jgi:hypothetical protein